MLQTRTAFKLKTLDTEYEGGKCFLELKKEASYSLTLQRKREDNN
jgi:hypothetical protein